MARAVPIRATRCRRSMPALLLLALTLPAVTACAEKKGEAPPPIRVVRAGYGDVATLRDNIDASVQGCYLIKKLPPVPTKLPSDATLAKLAVVEEEELFDGQMWAKYETRRSIGGDASQGCRLTLFVHRAATVERSCESRVRGQNELLGPMMDMENPSSAAPTVVDESLSALACKAGRGELDRQGVASEDAGGARCQWTADVIAHKLGKTGSGAAPDAFDTCLYEKLPTYYFEGQGRPVVLKTRSGNPSMTGTDISKIFGEAAAPGNLKLIAFSDGGAIDGARFKRAAVDAFVKLPARTTVGEP